MDTKQNSYSLPTLSLLDASPEDGGQSIEDLAKQVRRVVPLIQRTFAQFDVDVSVGHVRSGPATTRLELHLAPGVRMQSISALRGDLMGAIEVRSLRLLLPIPGTNVVGLDIPNEVRKPVLSRQLFESEHWQKTTAAVPVVVGTDSFNLPCIVDLAAISHLLIIGRIHSGDLPVLNSILLSLLLKFRPDQLKLVLIDRKGVEFLPFRGLPHLLEPTLSRPENILEALKRAVTEANKRHQLLVRHGFASITKYNLEADSIGVEPMPHLVIFIYELADLLLDSRNDIEALVSRIGSVGGKVGIHCIIGVERPSPELLPPTIKAEIPARMAFGIHNRQGSLAVFDHAGAEPLLDDSEFAYIEGPGHPFHWGTAVQVTDGELSRVVQHASRQDFSNDSPTCMDENGASPEQELVVETPDTELEASPGPAAERDVLYKCPLCEQSCTVAESLIGQNAICPHCNQEFHVSQSETARVGPLPAPARYQLPPKLPFFKAGRLQLLLNRLLELVRDGLMDDRDREELVEMALALDLDPSEVGRLSQEQMQKEFGPCGDYIRCNLLITREHDKIIRELERKYGCKLNLGVNTDILRATRQMAESRKLPSPIKTNLSLRDAEVVYYNSSTVWHQPRVTNYTFAGPSLSIPIIKGLRYRIASYNVARSESMSPLSAGVLYVTSHRLLFVGQTRNTSINYSKVVEFQLFRDALKILKDSGKPDLFIMAAEIAAYIVCMIGILKGNE